MDYTYKLEKYNGMKTKHTCPSCGAKRRFTRYVDASGNYIADHVGRCDRESNCGYHLKPKEYFESNPSASIQPTREAKPEPRKEVQYIPSDIFRATLQAYERNTFAQYLNSLFDAETVQGLIDRYGLGTTRDGSCIFWQADEHARIRTGKVIRYQEDGHRQKDIPPFFIHTKLKVEHIEQCLFGLHLLNYTTGPIGLVESEKTAVIMSGRLQDYTWMATGGKSNLSKVHVLKGGKVVAFPDTDAYDEWKERLSPYGFKVSNALQQHVSEPGYDLADFVTKAQDYIERLSDGREMRMHSAGYPLDWK
jgi:hypothetical protein